jgi:hypothetical protein
MIIVMLENYNDIKRREIVQVEEDESQKNEEEEEEEEEERNLETT